VWSAAALAAAAAVAMLFCLSLLPSLEVTLKDRSNHFEIHLELTSSQRLKEFVATIRELGLKIDDIETNPAYINSGLSVYSVAISITRKELKKFKTHREIIDALATLEYVSHIEEI
jgi:putative Mg2+ transporter-C (MgtC) family protein